MKKLLSVILALVLVLSLCAFTTVDGIGSVYKTIQQQIGPDALYTNITGVNSSAKGVVSAYTVEADVTAGKIQPYVYCGTVRSTKTLTAMTSAIESEGYHVVAGINGDLYDTSTGTPKGLVIHNGILYTGGYQQEYTLTFGADGTAALTKPTVNYVLNYVNSEGNTSTAKIGYFNVPMGGANALHLYNSRYDSTTKTTGSCAEVVLTVTGDSGSDLKAGNGINAVVSSVNKSTKSTAIGANQLVLSANTSSAYYNMLCGLTVGSQVSVSAEVSQDSTLINAKEAMGVYNVMALDGKRTTTDTTLNPRTAIGIKADGSVLLYVVDGRQTNVSNGMNAVDVTNYLLSRGCVSVMNMDGGGSTTMVARNNPGKSNSTVLVNSPSGGSQRAVTNGLFLVYKGSTSAAAAGISIYPVGTTLMPGMQVQLSSYGVNDSFESALLTDPVTYTVTSGSGSVSSSGVYTAGMSTGPVEITAVSGAVSGKVNLDVVGDITFSVDKTSVTLEPGASVDLNISSVKYGPVSVLYKDELFSWTCSSNIGSISSSGKFTAVSEADSTLTGNIVVTYGDKSITVPVTVKVEDVFTDISKHWAKTYITKLAKLGVIGGIGNGKFGPDNTLTRAQFLQMLSKVDPDENLAVTASTTFSDVKSTAWYATAVSWGVKSRIVNGYSDGTFKPDAKVTREQMCVMLYNYYIHKSKSWSGADKALTFKDLNKISDYALPAVKKVVNKGVMSGRTDGTFDPLGNATRAEAAKIIYMIL